MFKNLITFCKQVLPRQTVQKHQNLFYSNTARRYQRSSKVLLTGAAVTVFGGVYYYLKDKAIFDNSKQLITACCSSIWKAQNSVYSPTKKHALYLTIHLENDANVKEVVKRVCNLQKYVDVVCPAEFRDEENEILAGVGFGPNVFAKARPTKPTPENFAYHDRKGQNGQMPSTGGDLFIHAKSDELSKLFELTQLILKELPENSVQKFEDIYGWVYKNGRDLSGFIDGTENPADETDRQRVAVNEMTGGSFVIAQKWIHQHHIIDREKEATLDSWIGRKRSDSTELKRKSVTSHVARMTGGPNFEQPKKFEIVRQSQPYGTLSGENGLFFIGYSSTVAALDFMLDRMVGASEDGLSDDVMRLSKCVKSTYWYFPGSKELEDMARVV